MFYLRKFSTLSLIKDTVTCTSDIIYFYLQVAEEVMEFEKSNNVDFISLSVEVRFLTKTQV